MCKFGGIRSRGRLFLNGLMSVAKKKIRRNLDDFWNCISWEPLGRFLSNLIRKVTRL